MAQEAHKTPIAHDISALCLACPTATFSVPLSRWELRDQVPSFAPGIDNSDYPNTCPVIL